MRFSPAICFAVLALPSMLRGLDFAPREVETEIEAGIVNKETGNGGFSTSSRPVGG